MDLKEHVHNRSWILHMIDSATRYSAACLVYSKNPEDIVLYIFLIWITHFGCPKRLWSDNGGEFSNSVTKELGEKFNIEPKTTAAESPYSNGVNERHHMIIVEAMSKTVEETNCDPRLALAWAVSSHNSLCNHLGFSPNQLVFGFNPNYPSVLSDDLPALDTTTSNDLIRKMLNMKHTSWKQFVEAENSNRIRRALSHNVRTYSDVKFTNGDVVYYRQKNFKGWRGPGVVLGQEGQCVAARHQGEIYKVHPHQLLLREHFQAKGGSGNNHEGLLLLAELLMCSNF